MKPETIIIEAPWDNPEECRYFKFDGSDAGWVHDSPKNPKLPFLRCCSGKWVWRVEVDILTGEVKDWPRDNTLWRVRQKVGDRCRIICGDKEVVDFVPSFLCDQPSSDEYIELSIQGGCIRGWDPNAVIDFLRDVMGVKTSCFGVDIDENGDITEKPCNEVVKLVRRNFERFDTPQAAYLAWARETQGVTPEDYEFEDEDEWDQMQDLWTKVFRDDQNREFVDWLWEIEKEDK